MQEQIDKLNREVATLKTNAIQKNINPDTYKTLTELLRSFVMSITEAKPTSIYSTNSPTGTYPTGSIWIKDTGSVITNEIHSYSPAGWIRIK